MHGGFFGSSSGNCPVHIGDHLFRFGRLSTQVAMSLARCKMDHLLGSDYTRGFWVVSAMLARGM
jgi:hypothetical protein